MARPVLVAASHKNMTPPSQQLLRRHAQHLVQSLRALVGSLPPHPSPLPVKGKQQQQQPPLAAVAFTAALILQLASPLIDEAAARSLLTPDERVAIEVYKQSTPSVVSVSNMSTRRDMFTTNMNQFPQGQGSGFIFDKEGHVVTNFHVITEATEVKV